MLKEMQKFEYWIKDVTPEDAQNFLRMAGSKGWELISIIIKQKPKNFTAGGQYPQFEIFYSLVLKRILFDDVSYLDEEAEEKTKTDGTN